MRNRNRSNVLLVEILIAVLFFMLSATVILQVFATSRNLTAKAGVETEALAEAQNIAETLYAADDPATALGDMGYILSHGAWSKDYGMYSLYVTESAIETNAGRLWQGEVSAYYKLRNPDDARPADEELFTLPVTRYEEVR